MDINGVSLAELRAFVAVAEAGSVVGGARRLDIGQPAVSRSLARLERRLGVALLVRTTRAVTLTPAGSVLLRQVRHVPATVEAAARLAVRAADRSVGLRLGCKPDGDAGLLADTLARCATDERIDPAITLEFAGTDELVSRLRTGRLDAAFVQGPFDPAGLDYDELLTEPRLLAVSRHDALASVERVRMCDVPPDRIVSWPQVSPLLERYYGGITDDTAANQSGPPALDLAEALRLVELDRAVTLVPASVARRYARGSLVYREVDDATPAVLSIAWPAGARSAQLAALVRAAVTAVDGGPSVAVG